VWLFNAFSLVRLVLVALITVSPFNDAHSQDKQELERIEQQIESQRQKRHILDSERRALDRGVSSLRRNLIRAARTAQENEARLNRLEDQLPELKIKSKIQAAALQKRRRQMTATLIALERLSRNPAQALLLSDATPVNIVRNAILLRSAIPALKARAAALKNDLLEIQSIRAELDERRHEINVASRVLTFERNRLNALMGHRTVERRRMLRQTVAADARLTALNQKAQTLRDLFSNFAKEQHAKSAETTGIPVIPRQKTAATQAAQDAGLDIRNPGRGTMTLPARGRVIEQYGQDTKIGSSAKGASFRTRNHAQVVAPFDGRVVFAGPFKGYGQILIIQHGAAYHTLLAGMRRVDASLGQRLLAGEPIGVMGTRKEGTRLYVEVRRKGQPINPLPWFTATTDKVRG
jgi:septal ring factor EnvC (AmiA/AmiB activator)